MTMGMIDWRIDARETNGHKLLEALLGLSGSDAYLR